MNKLTEPITFSRGVTFKNRVIMAPMTTKMSFYDGVVTKDELAYYSLRTKEVGAVITAAANVQEDGKGWEGELGVYEDRLIPSLSQLASTIKQNGTKAILQIFHGGRMTDSKILRGQQPVAPSAVAAQRPNAEVPRALAEEEIFQLIQSFKEATRRAIAAGFDGVELHGANTYLLQQFFSPHSNRREDQWGGTLENRFKFIDQVVDAVLSAVDESETKNFIVGYRFSPEEYETPGIRFEDTLFLVDRLADKGLDYLHLSLNDFQRISISENYQQAPMIELVHQKIAGRVPLIGVGDVQDGKQAQAVLENAEAVAVGRALLVDPHWTAKVFANQEDQIRRELNQFDREELIISNGVWGFLENMMPERLK